MTLPSEMTPLQEEIMRFLVEDDFPLAEILAIAKDFSPSPAIEDIRLSAFEALTALMENDLVQLVRYKKPFDYDDRVAIESNEAMELLKDLKSWDSPVQDPDADQLRASTTELGQQLFF